MSDGVIVELYSKAHSYWHFSEVSVFARDTTSGFNSMLLRFFWASSCMFSLTQQMQHKSHTSQLWYSKTQRINSVVFLQKCVPLCGHVSWLPLSEVCVKLSFLHKHKIQTLCYGEINSLVLCFLEGKNPFSFKCVIAALTIVIKLCRW